MGSLSGLGVGVMLTAFALGLRHGVDFDHLAAIADLSGASASRRRGMILCTLYAAGHAMVILALGVAAIAFGLRLPESIDNVTARLVGISLVALGAYVVVTLMRDGRSARLRSRWSLLLGGAMRLTRHRSHATDGLVVIEHDHPDRLHHGSPDPGHPEDLESGICTAVGTSNRHTHLGTVPIDPFARTKLRSAFSIGILHGMGVETPTQVIVVAAAAGADAGAPALMFLMVFLAGLFCANTAVAVGATSGLFNPRRSFPLYVGVSLAVAVASLVIGTLLLLDIG